MQIKETSDLFTKELSSSQRKFQKKMLEIKESPNSMKAYLMGFVSRVNQLEDRITGQQDKNYHTLGVQSS